jgi:hypothetical protein
MESLVGKQAIYEVVDNGAEYAIDIIHPILDRAALTFDNNYLNQVIGKYYGSLP